MKIDTDYQSQKDREENYENNLLKKADELRALRDKNLIRPTKKKWGTYTLYCPYDSSKLEETIAYKGQCTLLRCLKCDYENVSDH